MMSTPTEISELVATLEAAREAYYNGEASLSDAEYDALEDELRTLAPKHAFFKKVGAKTSSKWRKMKHTAPMGSQFKVNSIEELAVWFESKKKDLLKLAPKEMHNRIKEAQLCVSEKLDGISVSLVYKNGKLVHAITRGDGEEGEDILRNVEQMQKVCGVRKFSGKAFTGCIRGEIILPKKAHQKFLSEYKNPRNAASGIARRETDAEMCKHLVVRQYQVLGNIDTPWKYTELGLLGHDTPVYHTCCDIEQVRKLYEKFLKTRDTLDYEIDGLIVEFDDLEFQEMLGEQDGRPKGSVALKFPHEMKPTKLRRVRWQVGLSGRITPVAEFDPVDLAGVTVTNASLHNPDYINALGLTDGAKILVSRRGDVIPQVEKVLVHGKIAVDIPEECPVCETKTDHEGAYLICPNGGCPAQVAGDIKRWVNKLDIKEIGDALIDALVEEGLVSEPAHLYYLSSEQLAKVQMSGKKLGRSSADKIVKQIDSTMDLPLHKFVGSLGIPMCSRSICQKLVDAGFDSLAKMRTATVSAIADVPGMGEIKAKAFVKGLRDRKDVIDNLLEAGVEIKKPPKGGLSGKSFCFTGFRDRGLENQIEAAGGIMKSSVARGLTYLVAKDPKSTSGKAAKARDYGVQVIGPDDLRKMF